MYNSPTTPTSASSAYSASLATTGPPRAFVPHSAINLSVKSPGELPTSSPANGSSTLDLSASGDAESSPYLLGYNNNNTSSSTAAPSSNSEAPQILDLTRPGGTLISVR